MTDPQKLPGSPGGALGMPWMEHIPHYPVGLRQRHPKQQKKKKKNLHTPNWVQGTLNHWVSSDFWVSPPHPGVAAQARKSSKSQAFVSL